MAEEIPPRRRQQGERLDDQEQQDQNNPGRPIFALARVHGLGPTGLLTFIIPLECVFSLQESRDSDLLRFS